MSARKVTDYEKEAENYSSSVPDLPRPTVSSLIEHPRIRNCFQNIQLGVKMGSTVGGIFGLLAGTIYAVKERRFLLLPATTLVCAASFGFFLGCGMIIRCENKKSI
jgi:Reactive mitochondrial oxygen species modulator 1